MDGQPARTSGSGLRKLIVLSGGAVFALGMIGLTGWVTGVSALSSLRHDYIPMAADTGFLFLSLGAILLSGAYKKGRGLVRSLALAFAGLASFYGALKSLEAILRVDMSFRSVLFPETGRLGAIALGRMSPVTGFLFFLSGLALLAGLLSRGRRLPREAASGLGAVVLVAGGVASTGYLFGTPLLYGGTTIPLAATTSAAFLFLGLGLTAAAGKDTVFAREVSGPSASARLLRGILPIIVDGMGNSLPKHGIVLRDRVDAQVVVLPAIELREGATPEQTADEIRTLMIRELAVLRREKSAA